MRLDLCAILCLATPAALTAQEEEEVSVAVQALTVMVDVVVTDDRNRLVSDLEPSDVVLLEDGVPQRIDRVCL